ncbi:MAG: hypothetical protein ACREC6_10905 [Hyphomicrobiaceae bacterium]
MIDFAGRWITTFGPMILDQEKGYIRGTYGPDGIGCVIEGTIENGRYVFRYKEPAEEGTGWFVCTRYGRFAGEYLAEGAQKPCPWRGHREFDGLWVTSFGRLRLIQNADRVYGSYGGPGPSTLEGHVERGRLVFRYFEPKVNGTGWFELDAEQTGFYGQWQPDGGDTAGDWRGVRAHALPGLRWLIVLEAPWQCSLTDPEFAFGAMLRELFARVSGVEVRQRSFQDEPSLLHWAREIQYIAEPVVLVIAGHGEPPGLSVQGRIIDSRKIVDALRSADDLALLHFSACLIGQDAGQALAGAPFAVSGYTTSVDWAQSALIEFIYLDMILEKGLSPSRAAEHLTRLVGFAGDAALADSPYRPAGFRFFNPLPESMQPQPLKISSLLADWMRK